MSTDTAEPEAQATPSVHSSLVEQARMDRQRAMAETTLSFNVAPFSNGDAFKLSCNIADRIAESTFIPADYQGRPSNVLVAMDYASRLGISPIMLMQNMDVVKGRPGLRGTFLIALINKSSLFSRLKFEWRGQDNPGAEPSLDFGCRAYATEVATGEVISGTWVDWRMVKAEGWDKNTKWTSIREQMFTYRAGAFWARANASDVTLGMYESEELRDALEGEFTRLPNRPKADRAAIADDFLSDLGQRAAEMTRENESESRATSVETQDPPAAQGTAPRGRRRVIE